MLLKAAALAIALTSSFSHPTAAQIAPDTSLGENASSVVSESDTHDRIEGGLILNSSLFHSFDEFNISAENSIYFTNPDGVEAIFTRVTGDNVSNLLGVTH